MKPAKKLYVKTYGCQMNVYDSGKMVDLLAPLGYATVDTPGDADMVILNTCHIREKAEEKVFSDLGRIKDAKKDGAIIAVAGCVAQAEGDAIIQRAPFVDIVLGPQTYHRLPEMVARAERARQEKLGKRFRLVDTDFPVEAKFDFLPEATGPQGASAYVSIQEGCDRFCTFCVVPYTRGAEYSRPAKAIIEEAKNLADKGVKEIYLLGQNVNAYHGEGLSGQSEWRLAKLIEQLAQDLPQIERIRYITSHPKDMTQDLIDAHRDIPALMPYLHLPVQSGSNKTLDQMNRQHTREFYFNIIDKLRAARSDLALSSDFIVGFPGETEQDFQDTMDLVAQVRYAQAYSFKYSIRPGTPAGAYEDQIPESVKEERLARLQALIVQLQFEFNQSKVGQTVSALFERTGKKPGQLIGKTPFLQSVYVEANQEVMGTIQSVHVTDGFANSLAGVIV
ncbi:MAG: tRNA (N6-isopentenyl adenosine(37)-C2)-methylthiotransferase MiaB [Alphaproteobacteria bacterium]|nr:tRNA (N6-isopentenyl adenosine(37)-C2)-methylthiotransferase MiaB [Alphaproteobacteria bacterium]OJV46368.1 MAG: tRNA (N6-isopentenyl adenosine(37)-C2)-methylthiotransferase MiaB [Alphaproteobacteria bacterium 43-37]